MFFVNNQHKRNFEAITVKFPGVIKNSEYRAACYIAAHPEIFKCFELNKQNHGPFDWYFDYLHDPDDFIARRDRGKTSGDTAPLTGSTRLLVELAINLWGGSIPVNLADGLVLWDSDLYRVAMQAIDLRRRRPAFNFGGSTPGDGKDA